jgi:hypothetical protein
MFKMASIGSYAITRSITYQNYKCQVKFQPTENLKLKQTKFKKRLFASLFLASGY